jgi:hypothetical protein
MLTARNAPPEDPEAEMAKKNAKKATGTLRRNTMLLQSQVQRRSDLHAAPPKQAERRHARPGAGIKRSRAAMTKKPTR